MRYVLLITICCIAFHKPVNAQTTSKSETIEKPVIELPSDVSVTPELWMYLHEYKQHQDPKQAVRRNAEFRAKQRRARLAAQKWFGHSPLRPTVQTNPNSSNSYGTNWIGIPRSPAQWTGYTSTATYSPYRSSSRNYFVPSYYVADRR